MGIAITVLHERSYILLMIDVGDQGESSRRTRAATTELSSSQKQPKRSGGLLGMY